MATAPASNHPPRPCSWGLALTRQPGSGFQQLVWQVCQQSLGRNTEEDGGDRGQQAPAHVAAKPGRDSERRRSPGQGDPASPRYSRPTGKQRTLQPPCPFVLGKHQAAPPLGHAHGSRPPHLLLSWEPRLHVHVGPLSSATRPLTRHCGSEGSTRTPAGPCPWSQPPETAEASGQGSWHPKVGPNNPAPGPRGGPPGGQPPAPPPTHRSVHSQVHQGPQGVGQSPENQLVFSQKVEGHQRSTRASGCRTRGRGSFSNPWATKGQPAPWRRSLTARPRVAPTAMRRRRRTDTQRVEHQGSTARLRPRPPGTRQQPAIRDGHRRS